MTGSVLWIIVLILFIAGVLAYLFDEEKKTPEEPSKESILDGLTSPVAHVRRAMIESLSPYFCAKIRG
ncbi:MAG: hypothetical protein IAF02_19650 [Anaerolineae bacterium]|nr:hypothetical protein [Anaerolineae bacterium]